MFVVAVVVDRDHAAADVGLAADDGIAEIAEMARLGAVAEARLFGLDKVADAVAAIELCAGAQVGERTDLAFIANNAFFRAHAELQMAAIADHRVAQPRGALDHHALTDAAGAENLHVGPNDGI